MVKPTRYAAVEPKRSTPTRHSGTSSSAGGAPSRRGFRHGFRKPAKKLHLLRLQQVELVTIYPDRLVHHSARSWYTSRKSEIASSAASRIPARIDAVTALATLNPEQVRTCHDP